MLQELHIRNIALIRELSVSFEEGLNILTGETGAGKTIIVDAVSLALGERGFKELIRHGEEKAYVEALVTGDFSAETTALIEDSGIEPGELIISRELTESGKNTCRINGRMVPLSLLRDIMSGIVDLHTQGKHQEIFNKKRQLKMLDRYAACENELARTASAYEEYSSVKKQLDSLETDEQERERLIDILSFQYKEIEAAKLKDGEEEALEQEKNLIRNAERITSALSGAHELLSSEGGALERLSKAAKLLADIAELDPRYEALYTAVNDAYYALEDPGYELAALTEEEDYDPDRLDAIETRLEKISSLKRKYGGTIAEIKEFGRRASERLADMDDSEARKTELKKRIKTTRAELEAACAALTAARRSAAEKMKDELVMHLQDLGMKDAGFSVRFTEKTADRNGADDAEFYISLNRGEPEKPLAKVASGGEASRIMLAVKNIFARKDDVSTMIFDEIDTGISGNMARVVAQKLANISLERQVICVSHLPQLAAMGDANFEIVKTDDDTGVMTTVKKLGEEEKLGEIARLSGGIRTEAALIHARELLNECEMFKNTRV